MKFQQSIGTRLILGLMVACLIPYVIGGFFLVRNLETWFYEEYFSNSETLLAQSRIIIEKATISVVGTSLDALIQSEEIAENSESLSSYVSGQAGQSMGEAEAHIANLFQLIRNSKPDIEFIFMGLENGEYMEFPRFYPDKPYDPRTRAWYMDTLSKGALYISPVYVTSETGQRVVSVSKPFERRDGVKGVLGIAVDVEVLRAQIEALHLKRESAVVVCDSEGTIVLSSRFPDWIMRKASDVGLADMCAVADASTPFHKETLLEGEPVLVSGVRSEPSDWSLISILPRSHLIEKMRSVTHFLIFIYSLILLILFLGIVFITRGLTRPVLEVANTIDHIADFDMEYYKASGLQAYADKRDEVGFIVRALNRMQTSFEELLLNIKHIEKTLDALDVTEVNSAQFELSDANPFKGVSDSFNRQLKRTQSYQLELKKSNAQMEANNEALMLSEEELKKRIREVDAQNRYIDYLAQHDPLTELPNRRWFVDRLNAALKKGLPGAVVLLDLDNFKAINDTKGHVYGDTILKQVAKRLFGLAREGVVVSRFGGDEFLIMVMRDEADPRAEAFVRALHREMSSPVKLNRLAHDIRFSVGVSLFPEDSVFSEQLIMNADVALYAVKNAGKNNYKYFDAEMAESILQRSAIEFDLKEAIETDGFEMCYQPQVDARTGAIYGYEALLRLKNRRYASAQFIPIAEDNGSIVEIGRLVTQKVVQQMGIWRSKGFPLKPISINYSARQLHDTGYVDYLIQTLGRYGVPAQYIELEITENIFVEDIGRTRAFLDALKNCGIRIAVDDFGKGYSSLSYLTYMPLDKLKLDRSIILQFIEMHKEDVVEKLIALAHSLKLKVVAEGIETEAHYRVLKNAGCDYIQGYYFSEPLDVETAEAQYYYNYLT